MPQVFVLLLKSLFMRKNPELESLIDLQRHAFATSVQSHIDVQ